MTLHETVTLSITIAAPFEAAYAFAHQPANFTAWASGLAASLHETDDGWVADTPEGEARVSFSSPNAFGVLDHRVNLPGRPEIYIPLRMVENGDGVEVSLLLLRQPGMTDEMFEKDAAHVRQDLAALKRVLEARG
ncbi:MAG: polyketide cyclase [Phenylobacterium zucineum]|nr:MAG: polyketide cyclase [Phenylobacterium zucineum]